MLPLLVLFLLGFCEGLDIQQARTDLAQGGRKVCPYCSYCVYKGYCPCSYPECGVCVYKHHCDTTCTGLCQTSDPCQPDPCDANSTCVERTSGKADCVCKIGHVCHEDQKCIDKGKTGQCEFYTCFEDRKHCGGTGYPLNYGYKYCTRFGDFKNDFTTDGQDMIDCVRKCLTSELLGHYHSNDQAGSPQMCEDVKNTAFNSHVKCYYDCDFCHVWSHNKVALYSVYDYTDFFSSQAVKQVAAVAVKCTNTTYQDIKTWISNKFTSLTDVIG